MSRRPASRFAVPLAVMLAAIAGSCTDTVTNPAVVAALQFDSLPYPAVVTGDTLRDSLGVAAPLSAIGFNGAGNVIANPAITYLALDSGITISPAGIVTAQLRNGPVRIIASVPGLQSEPETLIVARRPDSVVVTSPLADTLLYVVPDNSGSNVTSSLGLVVATQDTAGGVTGTQGWIVSYQLFFHGAPLAPADTSVASIWNSTGVTAPLDTTAGDGSVSRRIRVRPAGLPTVTESLTVVASVRYRGLPVRGSPVTYLIQIRPK